MKVAFDFLTDNDVDYHMDTHWFEGCISFVHPYDSLDVL